MMIIIIILILLFITIIDDNVSAKKTTSWPWTFNGGSKLRFILSLINITSISTAITPHHDCHSETRSVKSSFPACPHPAWQPQPSTGCIPQCIVILGYPAEHRALLCSVLHNWNSASIFIKSYLQCTQLALHRTCAVCTKSSFQDRIASHRTALCMHSLHCTNLHLKRGQAPVLQYIASHYTWHCITFHLSTLHPSAASAPAASQNILEHLPHLLPHSNVPVSFSILHFRIYFRHSLPKNHFPCLLLQNPSLLHFAELVGLKSFPDHSCLGFGPFWPGFSPSDS